MVITDGFMHGVPSPSESTERLLPKCDR